MNIKKILLPTDFSDCAKSALELALAQARRHEAELHVIHAVVLGLGAFSTFPDPSPEILLDKMEQIAKNQLDKLTDNIGKNVAMTGKTIIGSSAQEIILNYAKENEIDLIVLGTHGRRGLSHLFMGSVAEAVVRLAECPVLTTRVAAEEGSGQPFKKILVPVDFSKASRDMIRAAQGIAERNGASITLLHVVESYYQPPGMDLGNLSMPDVVEELKKQRRKHLNTLAQEMQSDQNPIFAEIASGAPHRQIAHYAEANGMDLIVMNTYGHSGLSHLILGSVAERTIRMAPCPVWTVRVK